MITKYDFAVSLAYVPREQLALGVTLMQFVTDENLWASPPEFFSDGFVLQLYGHCPNQSGLAVWYKVGDDGLVSIWDPEVMDGYELTVDELVARDPVRRCTMDEIALYLKGEL